jgi:hypothetical protein
MTRERKRLKLEIELSKPSLKLILLYLKLVIRSPLKKKLRLNNLEMR